MKKVRSITYLSDWSDVNSMNDNIDVSVVLDDGSEYTLVIATPNNIFWCMDNEHKDYFFGAPMLFVKHLTVEVIESAVSAIVEEDGGRWLSVYGR